MTTVERQVLENPTSLKLFLCILVPFAAGFNLYVTITGRIWASAILCFELAGFLAVMAVMRADLPMWRKILTYRHLFRIQILVFGGYLLVSVGRLLQAEVSCWCFIFIFLVSLWMPEKIAGSVILAFNAGIVGLGLLPDPNRFLANREFFVRFYVALAICSLLLMVAARFRHKYLSHLYRTRISLEQSEKKYRQLTQTLMAEIDLRDKAEQGLRNAVKMETVGKVAAGVAHDLNNILSGIVTYPELLLMDLAPDHPMREPLMTIQASGTRAAAIVDDLLTLSRRGASVGKPVDLRCVVDEYMASPEHRQLMAEYGSVRVYACYETDAAWMTGSPVHLSKALMNLVRNGVEAVVGEGEVRIRLRLLRRERSEALTLNIQRAEAIPPGQYVGLEVSDTGTGIDPAEQAAIFEPFYTRKQMGRSGTGLGMALVLGAVNDHNGYILLTSSKEQGTSISLLFPAGRDPGSRENRAGNLKNLQGKGERILVVDDEPVQLEIAKSLLRRLEYQVDACASGEGGIAFLTQTPVDLVILDIVMEPGMNGVATCERILERTPDQKILFVSGYSDAQTLARAEKLSRGPCLSKPYALESMGAMVRDRLSL